MWQTDKAWADPYLSAIEGCLRPVVGQIVSIRLVPTDAETDAKFASDYTVEATSGDIACRLRRPYRSERDWTIRSSRPTGVTTELEKLKAGYARWYFYGWTRNEGIPQWMLIDLDEVRAVGILDVTRPQIVNRNGDSAFVAVPIPELRSWSTIVTLIRLTQRGALPC